MDEYMRRLKHLFQTYTMVMTGVVFATALFTTVINPVELVESALLWQMAVISGLCTLMSQIVFPWERGMGRVEAIVRTLIHYILINVVVLGSGAWFEWYNPSRFGSVVSMILAIAVIFGGVTAISWKKGKWEAAEMNRRLEEYQKKEC